MASLQSAPIAGNALQSILAAIGTSATDTPWEIFRPKLLAQYGPRLRSKETLRFMESAVRVLEQLEVKSTFDLNVDLISRIVQTRNPGLSRNSVRSLLRAVQAICGHAVNFEFLTFSPFVRRPIKTWVKPSRPRNEKHLTKAELRKIFDVLDLDVREKKGWALWRARRLRALVTLVAWTGLRRSEALHSYVEDLELEAGILWVTSRESYRLKTEGSEQFVNCPAPAVEILRDWLGHRLDAPEGFNRPDSPYLFPNLRTDGPWVGGGPGCKPLDRLKAVALRAGIEGAGFQVLRRSVATHMEAAGCGAAQIQRQLRHSNSSTTRQFYMKADQENMRKAMENFGY